MSRKLELGDIVDLRAYERERVAFRERIMAIKRLRRIGVGPFVTLVFENRDTVRFQVQEMARAERILTDERVRDELDAYNPLIPEPGSLSATLFIELNSKPLLMEWLPQLVGIERAVAVRLGEGAAAELVRGVTDAAHAAQLIREDVTSAVHYIRFAFTPDQTDRFATGPATLLIDHGSYREETSLSPGTRAALLEDLRGQALPPHTL